MKLNRVLLLPAATVLAAGLLPIVLAAPANAAPPPIVVTGGDVLRQRIERLGGREPQRRHRCVR